eukprot:scaffold307365_cov27-Tisochrysis_lutea.AAC.3
MKFIDEGNSRQLVHFQQSSQKINRIASMNTCHETRSRPLRPPTFAELDGSDTRTCSATERRDPQKGSYTGRCSAIGGTSSWSAFGSPASR